MEVEVMEKVQRQVPTLRFPGFKGAWKNVSLENATGKTISYGIVQAGEHVEGGMPYIKSIDLNDELSLDRLQRTSMAIAHKYRRSEVIPGDIVFSLRGNIGVSQIVPSAIEVANLTQGTARISVSSEHSNVFVQKALQTEKIIKHVLAVMKGSTFQEISLGDLRQVEIHAPTLPEQQKIAAFLGAVDRRIQQLKRKQELLEQYKKGVVQQLFAQELRFKREDGGEFPEWEEKRFDELAKRVTTKFDPTKSESRKCIELEHVEKGTGTINGYLDSSTQLSLKSAFKRGDVLYGKLRPNLRKFHLATFDGVCSSEIWVFRGHNFDNRLLFYLVQSDAFNEAATMSSGSKMPRAEWSTVAETTFNVPTSLEEQSRIAGFLMALDAKVAGVAQAVVAAQRWKKGLLQQMFV